MSSRNSSSDDIYTYEGSPNVKVIYGYSGIVATFAFFVVIDNVIKKVGYPKHVKPSDVNIWRNTIKSWIHALIVSGWVIYSFVTKGEQMYADPFHYCDYTIYLLSSFSTGYFCYDSFDNLLNCKLSEKWEIHIHHLIISVSFLYNIQNRVYLPYTVFSLLPEINTVFLHFRKLMQLHGWPRDHKIYRYAVLLNFISCIIFRVIGNALFCISLYMNWSKVTVTTRVLIGVTLYFLQVLNVVLLWRLFNIDYLPHYSKNKNSIQNENMETIKNGNGNKDKYL